MLDLHCGDGNESLRPYVYQTVTADADLNRSIERIALAFGIDHIVIDRSRPIDPARSVYCSNTAITRGKPAITVESGYLGCTDARCVDQIVDGVRGVMRELGMLLDGPPPLEHAAYLDPVEVLSSPATGILYPQVEPGDNVNKGQVLARITDFFGAGLAEVRCAIRGRSALYRRYATYYPRPAGRLHRRGASIAEAATQTETPPSPAPLPKASRFWGRLAASPAHSLPPFPEDARTAATRGNLQRHA